jgi:DNA-directed RNA polymerase specialized sigma24 family protein
MEVRSAWELNSSSFDRLLRELHPDRERAAAEYEALRFRLTKFFEWRACRNPEDLADRTLDRLAQRLEGGARIDNIYTYCCGIARLLMLEARRASEREVVAANRIARLYGTRSEFADVRTLEALRGCLGRLADRSRQLVLDYYKEDKIAKIENRKVLASRLGIPLNALRSRAFRIRSWLENCVEKSVGIPKTPLDSSESAFKE